MTEKFHSSIRVHILLAGCEDRFLKVSLYALLAREQRNAGSLKL